MCFKLNGSVNSRVNAVDSIALYAVLKVQALGFLTTVSVVN